MTVLGHKPHACVAACVNPHPFTCRRSGMIHPHAFSKALASSGELGGLRFGADRLTGLEGAGAESCEVLSGSSSSCSGCFLVFLPSWEASEAEGCWGETPLRVFFGRVSFFAGKVSCWFGGLAALALAAVRFGAGPALASSSGVAWVGNLITGQSKVHLPPGCRYCVSLIVSNCLGCRQTPQRQKQRTKGPRVFLHGCKLLLVLLRYHRCMRTKSLYSMISRRDTLKPCKPTLIFC